jgi:hypothetical protein
MADKLQAKIDEYKEQMPDELYRQLCNLTMEEFKKEERKSDFYKVYFLIPRHNYDDCDGNEIRIRKDSRIVKLNIDDYNRIQSDITEEGFYSRLCLGILDKEQIVIVNVDYDNTTLTRLEMYPTVYKIEKVD